MKFIAQDSLPSLIAHLCQRGARPFTVRMETHPRLTKKNRITGAPAPIEWDGMVKRSHVNCFLNFNYQGSVNRQQVREGAAEGTFTAKANWFEHIPLAPSPLVRSVKDTTKLYLQLKSECPLESHYITNEGLEVSKAALAPFLPRQWESLAQSQGVEKPIFTFTVALANIVEIVCDGETYVIGAEVSPEAMATTAPLVLS